MANIYWASNYWEDNYWDEDYWQEAGGAVEATLPALTLTAYNVSADVDSYDYFSDDYFSIHYWDEDYWSEANVGGGSGTQVDQSAAAVLSLASFQTFAGLDQTIFSTTPGFTFTSFAADAANDVTVEAQLGTLTLTGFNPNTDNAGYVEADITVAIFASSAFSFTEGANATLEALTVSAQSPVAVEEQGATAVTVGSTPTLDVSSLPVTAANPVTVLPTTLSLNVQSYATEAGPGFVVQAGVDSLTLNGIQASVTGVPRDVGEVFAETADLTLSGIAPSILGVRRLQGKPESTFRIDDIQNADATTDVPSNYLICDLTGFRVSVDEGLHKTWDGLMVRRESYYSRHPQDMVRGRSDEQQGSPRPEHNDRFVSDEYPNGVSASDL